MKLTTAGGPGRPLIRASVFSRSTELGQPPAAPTRPAPEVTLGRVAAEAGVSRQAVYLHFGSQTRLLLALVTWIDEHGRLPRLITPAATADDPAGALLGMARAAADIPGADHDHGQFRAISDANCP